MGDVRSVDVNAVKNCYTTAGIPGTQSTSAVGL